jgi:hypothetical protein
MAATIRFAVWGAVMRGNFAAVGLMLAGVAIALASSPASAQVSAKTDFQVDNLMKAGQSLEVEMDKAKKGCITAAALEAFQARIKRLADERDSLALHAPDYTNFYPNRVPASSPFTRLTGLINDLREDLFELETCAILGEQSSRNDFLRRATSPIWTEYMLSGYLMNLVHGQQTSIETLRVLPDIQQSFHDTGNAAAGVGFAAGYLFAPANNTFRVGPFASFDVVRQTVNRDFAGGQFLGTTTHWSATAGAKAGAVVSPDLFLYGLAGVSWLNENLNVNFATAATSNVTIPGVTLGLGGEYRPASWQIAGHPVTLFAQYQHTWWRTANFYAPSSSPAFDYAFKREDDIVKLGVNFYFGAGPASLPASPAYPVKAPASK